MKFAENKLIYSIIKNKIKPFELALLAKKLFRINRIIYEKEGMYFYIDPVSDLGYKLMNEGDYEKEMTSAIKSMLNSDST
ncbi:MAG: hypothetical protein H0U27_09705, partial [Nitrosopumilus sp.]|nr:hypothetical protein [Nitrosopumilus sp.]